MYFERGATNDIERLTMTSLEGTVGECGEAYGEAFETRILGFCQQEVKPDKKRLSYAERCWVHIERDAPISAEFIKGMAAGSHLSLEHVTLLTLHEEIAHGGCTAFAASAEATLEGKAIIGQNWDFPPSIYPWVGLLRLELEGALNTLTYHMPGLWACAGINEAGLSLVWTSTGIFPPVLPEVGVPTYVVVAEILRHKSVRDAIRYIKGIKLAGAFNFFLGDASGSIAVVEAMPGYVSVDQSGPTMTRANHYANADMVRLARQDVSGGVEETYATVYRSERMAELIQQYQGEISPAVAKEILLDREGDWPWLHQYPAGVGKVELKAMTLDSLFAVCKDRVFFTCRGGREPGPWQEVTL
jgi:isopenicillin-N N-acyltransferase-like protein